MTDRLLAVDTMHALCSNTKIVKETMHKGKYHKLKRQCWRGLAYYLRHEFYLRQQGGGGGDAVVCYVRLQSEWLDSA